MGDRPNLLLFMPDQLRMDSVGTFGNPVVNTPNIDALAARGAAFTNSYSQHSVCSQSRVSMFTGWYPHVNGHRTLNYLLQPHEPNVFRSLRAAGYHVALAGTRGDMIGRGVTEVSADRFGFSRRPAADAMARMHSGPYPPGHRFYDAFYTGRLDQLDDAGLDYDEATVGTAIDWITDGLPEPWCLLVALMYPHPPFGVTEPWFSLHDRDDVPVPVPPTFAGKARFVRAIHDRYGLARLDESDWRELIATYYGMISRVDNQLGRTLTAVDQAGSAENTVTFFFTDHGEYLGDFGLVEKWPSGVDDCLVHNPLVIHDPQLAPRGKIDGFVEMVDLTATLLDYGEVEPHYSHFGHSLVPMLRDPTATLRDAVFSEGGFVVSEQPRLESGVGGQYQHKIDLQHEDTTLVGRSIAIRTDEWSYVHRLYEQPELYDRRADPRETTNLVADPQKVATVAQLKDRIFAWLFETSDVIPWDGDERWEPVLIHAWMGDEIADMMAAKGDDQ